jgi:hypothetical protein
MAMPTRSGRQRGSVVDAVTNHGDRGLRLERRDLPQLVLGPQARNHIEAES